MRRGNVKKEEEHLAINIFTEFNSFKKGVEAEKNKNKSKKDSEKALVIIFC